MQLYNKYIKIEKKISIKVSAMLNLKILFLNCLMILLMTLEINSKNVYHIIVHIFFKSKDLKPYKSSK